MSIAKRLHQEVAEGRLELDRAEAILQKLFGEKKHEQQEFQFTQTHKGTKP